MTFSHSDTLYISALMKMTDSQVAFRIALAEKSNGR